MAIAISYSPFAVKTKRRCWNVIVTKCVFAGRRKANGVETIDEFSTLDVGVLVCAMPLHLKQKQPNLNLRTQSNNFLRVCQNRFLLTLLFTLSLHHVSSSSLCVPTSPCHPHPLLAAYKRALFISILS
jgi:hypothetical protein